MCWSRRRMGDIQARSWTVKMAPLTVAHFLGLVDSGFYDGTDLSPRDPRLHDHRAAAIRPDLTLKETGRQFRAQRIGKRHAATCGAPIAMARTNDPHSANSQFFINVADNNRLDAGNNRWGYTVFGYVIEGMEVVDEIVAVQTGPVKANCDPTCRWSRSSSRKCRRSCTTEMTTLFISRPAPRE